MVIVGGPGGFGGFGPGGGLGGAGGGRGVRSRPPGTLRIPLLFTGLAAAWFLRPLVLRHERARWSVAVDALTRVGLGDMAEEPAGRLTYGQRRLLEVARIRVVNLMPALVIGPVIAGIFEVLFL